MGQIVRFSDDFNDIESGCIQLSSSNTVFLTASQNDSTVLMEVDTTGHFIWQKKIDLVLPMKDN